MNRNYPQPSPLRMLGIAAFMSAVGLTMLAQPAMAQQAEEVEIVEDAAASENNWSPGMYLPLDGSSVKAFEGSLEEVQAQTTETEFATLQNALEYLLVYDLASRRDPEVLYERLNGKTPADVIGMVKWKLRGESDGA